MSGEMPLNNHVRFIGGSSHIQKLGTVQVYARQFARYRIARRHCEYIQTVATATGGLGRAIKPAPGRGVTFGRIVIL